MVGLGVGDELAVIVMEDVVLVGVAVAIEVEICEDVGS